MTTRRTAFLYRDYTFQQERDLKACRETLRKQLAMIRGKPVPGENLHEIEETAMIRMHHDLPS